MCVCVYVCVFKPCARCACILRVYMCVCVCMCMCVCVCVCVWDSMRRCKQMWTYPITPPADPPIHLHPSPPTPPTHSPSQNSLGQYAAALADLGVRYDADLANVTDEHIRGTAVFSNVL